MLPSEDTTINTRRNIFAIFARKYNKSSWQLKSNFLSITPVNNQYFTYVLVTLVNQFEKSLLCIFVDFQINWVEIVLFRRGELL